MAFAGETLDAPAVPADYNPIERQEEARLLGEALAANPEISASNARYGLLTVGAHSPYSNIARALECQVFDHYFQNNPAEMQAEYGPYEDQSVFFLLVDREKLEPAGVMRILTPGPAGFKSVNDLTTEKSATEDGLPVTNLSAPEITKEFGIDESSTLDIATIVAHPEHGEKKTGSPIVLAALERAVHIYSATHNYTDLVAIIDGFPLSRLEMIGLPVKKSPQIAEHFKYLGAEDNTFIHIPVGEVDEAVSQKNQLVYDYVFGEAELNGEAKLSFQEQ